MPYRDKSVRKAYNTRYLEYNRSLIQAAKGKPCADCQVRYPYYVMQFDHIAGRGPKLFDLGKAVSKSPALLIKEIDKCEVVCANCHAARTYFRRS